MLSGIGPKNELQKHGIKQLLDLPVGQNLQDHCMAVTELSIGKPQGQMTVDPLNTFTPSTLYEFYSNGTGPLSHNGFGVIGVLHTPPFQDQKRPGEEIIQISILCQSSFLMYFTSRFATSHYPL